MAGQVRRYAGENSSGSGSTFTPTTAINQSFAAGYLASGACAEEKIYSHGDGLNVLIALKQGLDRASRAGGQSGRRGNLQFGQVEA